ncbi:hypothetical protein [uncultured Nostoc sp.]|uniref:hypothetical protein n=1 Tax=uncultured Nostoc sp. TaxID=340711 RepID=UPI0035CB226A
MLQLSNNQNWQLVYNQFHRANIEAPKSRFMYVIGEVTIPFLFESSIVSILVSLNQPTWKYAGYFRQKILTGIAGSNQDTYLHPKYRIDLNKIMLLQFPLVTNSYSLTFQPPEWIQEATLKIWTYIGEN